MTPRPCVKRECSVGKTQRALELADAAEPLQPRGIEQVLLGVLGGQPGRG